MVIATLSAAPGVNSSIATLSVVIPGLYADAFTVPTVANTNALAVHPAASTGCVMTVN
jgi:hypothetical protein